MLQSWSWAIVPPPYVIGPLILALIGLALVRRAAFVPRWMTSGAACGACGYEIATLARERCPECGADLVKVGIVTPRMGVRLRGSFAMLIIGWTLAIVAIAWPPAAMLQQKAIMNQLNSGAYAAQFKTNTLYTRIGSDYVDAGGNVLPAGPRFSFRLAFDIITDGLGNTESGTVRIVLIGPNNQSAEVTIDISAATWDMNDDTSKTVRSGVLPFVSEDARQLIALAGIDVDELRTGTEADMLTDLVRGVMSDPSRYDSFVDLSSMSASGSSSSSPYTSAIASISIWTKAAIATGVSAAVLYVAGLIWLSIRRSRLLSLR